MYRLGICAVIAVSVAIGLFAGLGISIVTGQTGPTYPELQAELDELRAELETERQAAERAKAESQVTVADTPSPVKADAQPHEELSEQPQQPTESTTEAKAAKTGLWTDPATVYVTQRGLASLGRNQRKKVSSQFGKIRSLFANDLLFTTKARIP